MFFFCFFSDLPTNLYHIFELLAFCHLFELFEKKALLVKLANALTQPSILAKKKKTLTGWYPEP